MLEFYGYKMKVPKGCIPITVPRREPIKRVYVQMVKQAIENAQDAKRAWLEVAIEDGIEINELDSLDDYSGQLKLRLPRSLHR